MMHERLFKPKKYNFDTTDLDIIYNPSGEESGYTLEEGHSCLFITESEYIESFEFYVHEFTEIALLSAIKRCTRKWMWYVRFKGFKASRVAHLVSPFGFPNRLTLFPDPTIRKAYKSLCLSLTKDELEIRKIMGDGWNE